MENIFKKLLYRNLIYNYTNNINNFFLNKKNVFYIGIDPTYNTLHIGHLLSISIINRLYKLGYKKNIIIIGGATTLINKKYKKKEIYNNINKIKTQLINLIYNKKVKIINNLKFYKKKKILIFIRNIFNNFSVNSLLKIKKNKKKLKNNLEINFNSFIYHILQSYDYYYLNKKYKCNLQIGGSDQWYNIISGIKLIKKKIKKKVYGFTFPLLLNNKGIKFSKSNKNINNIWINKKKTSIYDFYQYFINLSDKEAINYLKLFTFLNIKNIKKLIIIHKKNIKKKYIQKYLLKFFINWVYNKKIYKNIKKVMDILFKKNNNKLIYNNILLIKKYIKNIKIKINKNVKLNMFILINLNKDIFNSYNEYKKYINNNGKLLINGKKIINNFINTNNLILNKFIIIKKGKKNFFLLKIIYNE
ncbi:MAG: tyrosine--tRNA ligase [Candidatus Shikimatogenerans sp. JK-2022]|nr:tyrosine--tRNA ligase [Candidatus Shikimatogenerans bostrichidophilus]